MTSKEFVIWLKGFAEACNDFHPTPKQWDTIKEELDNITDEPESIVIPNGSPVPPLNWPINSDPYNMYKITCDQPNSNETEGKGYTGTVIPTPGTTGFLNIANPNTSTTYAALQSGSWHYTTREIEEKIF